MDEGYIDTLGIAAEGKFPVRRGTQSNPEQFVNQWKELEVGVDRRASLGEIYSDQTIDQLIAGLETGSRWGFPQGYGALTSTLYETRVVAELVREYIDGQISVDEARTTMQSEVESLMD
jgi:multiple sugar transport system substrate-binding protein